MQWVSTPTHSALVSLEGLPKSAYATIYVADRQVHCLKSWSIITEFGIPMQLQLQSTDAVQNVNPCNQLKSCVKVMELDYQYHAPKCPLKLHKQGTMLSVMYYLTLHIV